MSALRNIRTAVKITQQGLVEKLGLRQADFAFSLFSTRRQEEIVRTRWEDLDEVRGPAIDSTHTRTC